MKHLFISLFFLASVINSFGQGKTAYISSDEVFANIPQVIKADSLIRLENDRLSAIYKDREEELNDLYKIFVSDSGTMTADVKEIKRKKLQEKVTAFQSSKQELQNELETYREKVYAPIKEKVLLTIKDIAKAKGYTTCLYKESALFFPPNDDITRLVIKKMGGK
jgi:outer membrane protein